MARFNPHARFNPKGPFIVRREFRYNGRPYLPGDELDPKNTAIAPRKIRALYESNRLALVAAPEAPRSAPAAPVAMSAPEEPTEATEAPTEPVLDPDELSSFTLKDLQAMAEGMDVEVMKTKSAQIKRILGE